MVSTFVVIYVILAPLLRDTSHFVHRRVILDYVKRDACDFCRYLCDPRLRKKRHPPHVSLFTILYHINAELIVTFVVIYECLATLSREALEFCRQARDSRLHKNIYDSFLSVFA